MDGSHLYNSQTCRVVGALVLGPENRPLPTDRMNSAAIEIPRINPDGRTGAAAVGRPDFAGSVIWQSLALAEAQGLYNCKLNCGMHRS
jgi:hypothetical protein